jgi:hypothetical protein
MLPDLLSIVGSFQRKSYHLTNHVVVRMVERHITFSKLHQAIGDDSPEIVEVNHHHIEGPRCRIMAHTKANQPLHIWLGYGSGEPVVITVYDPTTEPLKWFPDLKTRR